MPPSQSSRGALNIALRYCDHLEKLMTLVLLCLENVQQMVLITPLVFYQVLHFGVLLEVWVS